MGFNGLLISVGNYKIPTEHYINAGSYSVTRTIQDLDSYRDGNGVLHRDALEHIVYKVEFETPPMLTNVEIGTLFSEISKNYLLPAERKAMVTLYDPETDRYITQDMYLANPKIQIRNILNGKLNYEPVRISFTGY